MLYVRPAMKLRWKRGSKHISTCSRHHPRQCCGQAHPIIPPCSSSVLLCAPGRQLEVGKQTVSLCEPEITGIVCGALPARHTVDEGVTERCTRAHTAPSPAPSPPPGAQCAPCPATPCPHQCRLHVTHTARLPAALRGAPLPDQAPAVHGEGEQVCELLAGRDRAVILKQCQHKQQCNPQQQCAWRVTP